MNKPSIKGSIDHALASGFDVPAYSDAHILDTGANRPYGNGLSTSTRSGAATMAKRPLGHEALAFA
jgi:hypothetical protein